MGDENDTPESGTEADTEGYPGKSITFSFQWKCPYKDLVGKQFDDDVYSPVFLVVYNEMFYQLRLRVQPAGGICCDYGDDDCSTEKSCREHMGVYLCLYKGLTDSVKIEFLSAAYSTNTNPQPIELPTLGGLYEVTEGGLGNPEMLSLVEQYGYVLPYTLPFVCNTVTFQYTFRIPKVAFSLSKILPGKLVCTDDNVLTTLYSSTLATPRHPTVDVTLVCEDGVKVHAHKGVLAAVSEVFKGWFHTDLEKNAQPNEIKVCETNTKVSSHKNVFAAVFHAFSHWFYSDANKNDTQSDEIKLEILKSEAVRELVQFAYLKAPSDGIHLNDVVADVLKAAHMYMVEPLTKECERIMVERIMKDEMKYAIDYYCLTVLYKLKILKNVCTVAILENWSDLEVLTDERLKHHRVKLAEKLVRFSRTQIVKSS